MATVKATEKNNTETVPEAMDFGAEGWRPEPGSVISGKVTDITTGQGDWSRYPIVTLATTNGEVNVHAFHHTLKNRLREMRPKVGHTLTITYLGMVDQVNRKTGDVLTVNGEVKTLAQYTVESPEFDFNWDAFD